MNSPVSHEVTVAAVIAVNFLNQNLNFSVGDEAAGGAHGECEVRDGELLGAGLVEELEHFFEVVEFLLFEVELALVVLVLFIEELLN